MIKRFLSVAILVASCGTVWAQSSFISLSGDARTAALGGSSAAAGADAFSSINNIAATVSSDISAQVGVSYMNWQPDYLGANIMSAAGYYQLSDKLAIGALYQFEMLPSQDLISSTGSVSGSFTPQGSGAGVGVGYALSEQLSVGATAKFYSTKLYTLSQSAVAVDLALNYQVERGNLAITLNNLSFGGELESPMSINLAASQSLFSSQLSSLALSAAVGYILSPESISSLTSNLGAEYGYDAKYFVRAGYSYTDQSYVSSWSSLGLGVAIDQCRIDAAYLLPTQESSPIKGSWMLSVSFGL